MSERSIALIAAADGAEAEAAESWLAGLSPAGVRRFSSLQQVPLAEVERLWVHAVSVDPTLELVAWLRAGGRLLATLDAADLPWRLGLEPQPPDDRRAGTWRDAADEFRPDTATSTPELRHARGLVAFGPHPLFRGFGNGIFTWAPVEGEAYRWLTYRGRRPERGAGVAVERVGRTVHAPRWIAWEYQVGEGGILCIGAFAQLSPPGALLGAELRGLLANALLGDAIPHSTRAIPAAHWPGLLPDDDESAVVAAGQGAPAHLDEIWDEWPPTASAILAESGAREDRPWTLTGRRALLTGTERHGLREIWTHPYRLVKDARLLVNDQEPEVTLVRIAPDEVVRLLRLGEVELTERFGVALDQGVIFWSVTADGPATVKLRWESDLRRAEPYPARSSQLRVHAIGPAEMRATLSHEPAVAQIMAAAGALTAHGSRFEVAGENLVRVVLAGAGTEAELGRILDALRRRKLRAYRQERILHARRLEERLTIFEAPDSALVRAFAWAKVRLDATLTETPGVGRSVLSAESPERASYLTTDACRVASAALAAGDREIARDTLRFLTRHRDRSGRVATEVTASGLARHDDPSCEAAFAQLAATYLAWTGDRALLEKLGPGLETTPPSSSPTATQWQAGDWEKALDQLRQPPEDELLLRGVIEGLWGVSPDAPRESLTLEPFLPDAWPEMTLRRLRVGTTMLDLRLRRRPGAIVLRIERLQGPRLRLSVALRSRAPLGGLTLNDEPLGGGRAVFDTGSEDEVRWLTS